MPNLLQQFFRQAKPDFSLSELEDFPYAEYASNAARYREDEEWFQGDPLEETLNIGQTAIDKYPIRVNPIYSAVLKHAYSLFGEYPDDTEGPLVRPKVLTRDGTTDDDTKRVEDTLYQVWAESNAASLMMEQGIISQVYGGCVFRVAWVPDDKDRETSIRIELIRPHEFMGIPFEDDPWRLRECWLIREITRKTAADYGVEATREKLYYIEHWTPDRYKITIDDVPLQFVFGGEAYKLDSKNPFGMVPFVYIPHVRYGQYYGDTMIRDSLRGITREMNARAADAGDAVSDDTHVYGVMKNVRGRPEILELAPGMRIVNLGMTQNLIDGNAEPSLEFPRKSTVSETTLKLTATLYDLFRRESFVPAVAEGEDEGSQRSALTLATRMWPLVSHVKQERAFWSTGLRTLNRMILKILAKKSHMEITEDDLKLRLSNRWYAVLPRDREQLVNELSIRAAAQMSSPEHLMTLAGDIENIPEERERILQWLEDLAKIETEAQLEIQEQQLEAQQEMMEAQGEQDMEMADKQGEQQMNLADKQGQNMQKNTQLQGKNQVAAAKARPKTPPKKPAGKK